MKRFIPYFALLAVVAFVGCSGNSPSAPAVPTVVPSAWNITTLSVSDANPFIGSPVFVQAVVTRDGAAAPDGTAVDFKSSGPGSIFGFTSGDLTKGSITLNKDGTVLTENGTASVFFLAADDPQDANDTPAGTYLIQARVQNVTKQVNVTYNDFLVPDQPQLLDVNPRRGSYDGGEIVDIVGRRIEAPVDVFFDVEGSAYQAVLMSMVDFCLDGSSLPSCNNNPDQLGQGLTVQTPAFTGLDTSIDRAADIRVISGSGTGFQQTAGLTQIYVLVRAQGAVIFGVSPNSGRSSGGEIVNVLGQGFGSVASDLGVSFIDEDSVGRLGTVLAVSPDGAQIQVETPLFSTTPLDKDRLQDVQVSTPTGVVTLDDAFVVLADNPQPTITSISPTAGPLDGGTLMTMFGHGFQAPMQVFFGNLTALDVNVFNDTTPGDNDRITCVTPDYSQQGDVPPVTVDVRVRNMESGKEHSLAGAFRYGDQLYISGNSPSQGQRGDLVLIFGSGFEDPLQVFFPENSAQQMEVVSVTGTELVVRVPDSLPPSCGDTASRFKVQMIETNNEVIGGNFTILGNAPLVLSVAPVTLQEDGFIPSGVNPDDITITGNYFVQDSQVRIGNFVMPSNDLTVASPTTIEVRNLPGIDDLGVSFPMTGCTTGGGLNGARQAPVAVNVTVTNFPGSCSDTLAGAFVIEPFDTTCNVAAGITVSSPTFPPTQAPGPSPGQTLTITETSGAATLDVSQLNLFGRFFFDAGCSTQVAGPLPTIPVGGSDNSIQVFFCPNQDDGANYNGTLTVTSSAPSSPDIQSLSGPEAFPIMSVTPLNVSGNGSFTISNAGTGTLTWSAPAPGGVYTVAPLNGVIAAGGNQIVNVTVSGPGADGSVTVTAGEPDAQGSPETVILQSP